MKATITVFFVDKDSKGVSEYFQIPTGRKNEWNNCHRHERKSLFEYRLGKQKNGYQIARRNQSDNVVVEISEIGRQPKFVLTHNKLKFSTDDYNFAVLDLVGDRFAIIVADGFYHLAKNGTEMPIDGFKSDLDKIRQINVRPFLVAYKGGLEQYQHRIFRMMAETHVGGHRFQELRKSNGEDLVNEQQAIFKILIKGDVEDKHYWVNFHKNLPRSFEIISDESKFSELFKLLNAFPAGVLTSQNCGEEQVRIDKATCGLVIQLTDKATLVLSNHQNSGFSNAWLVTEQSGVVAGQWRPSSKLLKEMAQNNEPLIEHIKDSGKLKKYLANAIHSELTAGFNLILGKSECSLTPKNPDCKSEIRVATIYDSTTSDTKLEIFHSSDKCLLSSKKEINDFWQLTDLNLTRQENLIINGKINHEKMLESIIDESWQDNWRANPIGPFKQGTLNKKQGGCEYGNN